MRGLLDEYADIFRIRLGPDPAADVEPMKVHIRSDSIPYITKARRYPIDQREFIDEFMDRLIEYEIEKPNPNAEWAPPALLVPKNPPVNID